MPLRHSELVQAVQHPKALIAEIAPELVPGVRQPRPLRRLLAPAVLPRQKTAGQREVGENADVVPLAQRQQLVLRVAHQHAVLRLHADVRRQVLRPRGPDRLAQLPSRVVGAANVAHLPGPHQVVQRPQRLLDGRQRVRPVDLVQVDVVRVQGPQARLYTLHDVLTRCPGVVGAVPHPDANLGPDQDLRSDSLDRLPNVLLGLPARSVRVRRVQEIDPLLHRLPHHLQRALPVDPRSKVVGPQTHHRDLQARAPQSSILHLSLLSESRPQLYQSRPRPSGSATLSPSHKAPLRVSNSPAPVLRHNSDMARRMTTPSSPPPPQGCGSR